MSPLFAPILVPAVFGVFALRVKGVGPRLSLLVVAAVVNLGFAANFWLQGVPAPAPGTTLELDPLGLLFLSLIAVLFLAAAIYCIPTITEGSYRERGIAHRFVACLLWFLAAMNLVCLTRHLSMLWVAIECTTLASAPLVYYSPRKGALEASWKYLVLCSTGIALALLGTLFMGISAMTQPGASLDLSTLLSVGPMLSPRWLKAAFVLAVVGYGTKMGLAPMHTWLPDTHSQAPSPVSGLLSGALLNCAFLGILRFYQVCLASGHGAFARDILILLGFFSLLVACALMFRQGDFKRLFAYSSIENMGILAIGVGLGGVGSYGALFHAVNHSVCKAGLFFLAGNIVHVYGTTATGGIHGLFRVMPPTAILLFTLALALGGLPPFGAFFSKFLVFQAAVLQLGPFAGAFFLLLAVLSFLAMAGVLLPMLQGEGKLPPGAHPESLLSLIPGFILAIFALTLGLFLPPALGDLLRRASLLVGG